MPTDSALYGIVGRLVGGAWSEVYNMAFSAGLFGFAVNLLGVAIQTASEEIAVVGKVFPPSDFVVNLGRWSIFAHLTHRMPGKIYLPDGTVSV